MFTGIITTVGIVKKKTKTDLQIEASIDLLQKLEKGTSIAVDGICLTVVSKNTTSFVINFMPETAEKTNIAFLKKESLVNLELPATVNTLFSGHIVQGHIDTIGIITAITPAGNSRMITFSVPESLHKYIVKKGSIAVNGISLTVVTVSRTHFSVGIIPHTWENTMLNTSILGDTVNIEVDILAKYIENLIQHN